VPLWMHLLGGAECIVASCVFVNTINRYMYTAKVNPFHHPRVWMISWQHIHSQHGARAPELCRRAPHALPHTHCYTCIATHVLLHTHCYTCIAPHALLHMYCYTCIATHSLPHMHCPTRIATHILLHTHCYTCIP
jgi:hypothetical protein